MSDARLLSVARLCYGVSLDDATAAPWNDIFDLARRDGCLALIWWRSFAQIRAGAPALAPQWQRLALLNGKRADVQVRGARRIWAALQSAGLDASFVKGAVLSQHLFGDPGIRLSRDLDLCIAADQRDRAHEVLIGALQTTYVGGKAPSESQYVLGIDQEQVPLEVHSSLLGGDSELIPTAIPLSHGISVQIGEDVLPMIGGPTLLVFLALELSGDAHLTFSRVIDFRESWLRASDEDRRLAYALAAELGIERFLSRAKLLGDASAAAADGDADAVSLLAAARRELPVHRVLRLLGPAARVKVAAAWLIPSAARRDPAVLLHVVRSRLRKLFRLARGHSDWRES